MVPQQRRVADVVREEPACNGVRVVPEVAVANVSLLVDPISFQPLSVQNLAGAVVAPQLADMAEASLRQKTVDERPVIVLRVKVSEVPGCVLLNVQRPREICGAIADPIACQGGLDYIRVRSNGVSKTSRGRARLAAASTPIGRIQLLYTSSRAKMATENDRRTERFR